MKTRTKLCVVGALIVSPFAMPSVHAEIFEWTGSAPILTVEWFNGITTEFHEFQYITDWQGYCNAHAGAVCQQSSFWGSPSNWDRNTLPGLADSVRTTANTTVSIGSFNSIYQGNILGAGAAGSLSMGDGSILNLNFGTLRIANNGYIPTLQLGLSGTLWNDGSVMVANLEVPGGKLRGTGTTTINGSSAAKIDTLVQSGHTLRWGGDYSGTIDITLEPLATFHNVGTLRSGSGVGAFRLPGFTSRLEPGIVLNTGVMEGSFLFSDTRLLNNGFIDVGAGSLIANNNGTHSGSFVGANGSEMRFTAIGSGNGHRFLPGSSLSTQGRVVFSGANHIVEGAYAAQETIVGTSFATVRFLSRPDLLPVVVVNPTSQVTFESHLGVDLGELTIGAAGASAFAFFSTSTASKASKVSLLAGGLNTQADLNITGELRWDAGTLIGPVSAGSLVLGAGTRTLTGTLSNSGIAVWNAGSFRDWTGKVINASGATFDLKTDVTVSGTGGSFDNAGQFVKSGGTGVTTFSIAFNNAGALDVQMGSLRLTGGGLHSGDFSASPGARIELSGNNRFDGNVSPTGDVSILGGHMHILNGAYTNTSQIAGVDLQIDLRGRLLNRGVFNSNLGSFAGRVDNFGEIDNQSPIFQTTYLWNVDNRGTIRNASNASMQVIGSFEHSGQLLNEGSFQGLVRGNASGGITNSGTMRLGGLTLNPSGTIDNTGSLDLQSMLIEGHIRSPSTSHLLGFSLHIAKGGSVVTAAKYLGDGTTSVDGVLETAQGFTQDYGFLKGSGVVRGDVTLGGYAQMRPGKPGTPLATLTIEGNLDIPNRAFGPDGNIVIEIVGANDHSELVVRGSAVLDAVADLTFSPSYLPKDGQSYTWLRADSVSGFVESRVLGLPFDWQATTEMGPTAITTTLVNEPVADFLTQIQTFGVVRIDQGAVGQNFVSRFSPVSLDRLDNHGWFVNQTEAGIKVFDLQNWPGAKIANRGDMRVTGLFDNSGTIYNRPGGIFSNFAGGSNTGTIINAGRFDVTDRAFTNAKGGYLESRGELGIYGFFGGQLINDGEVQLFGNMFNNYTTAYFQGTIRNRGTFVVNRGAMIEGQGSYHQVYGNDFTEPVTIVNGVLGSANVRFSAGSFGGSGKIIADTVSAFGVLVEPGNSPGTLTIEGNLVASNTTFQIEFAGDGGRDVLHVTGQTTLIGTNFVHFLFLDSYAPQAGDTFVWLASDGGVSGLAQLAYSVYVRSAGGELTPWDAPANLSVAFRDGRFEVTAVPEPEQWALFVAGLVLVSWAAYRRSNMPRHKIVARLSNGTLGEGTAEV